VRVSGQGENLVETLAQTPGPQVRFGDGGPVVAGGDGGEAAARDRTTIIATPGSGPMPNCRNTFAPAM